MKGKLKRFAREEAVMVNGSPNGTRKRWVVYEADAQRAIDQAYRRGMNDALKLIAMKSRLR